MSTIDRLYEVAFAVNSEHEVLLVASSVYDAIMLAEKYAQTHLGVARSDVRVMSVTLLPGEVITWSNVYQSKKENTSDTA